ncbi:thiosulfate oxidation carrier protein SoxY [Anaeromyxobacter sp. PSR-1]|uniref:thiosulfate oxidation carrier protein SoxY n=1 Tax=unclassified Anaeromyxobacter TaxID=2620896 RepID=UPI0005E3ECDE|nr:thiosulfate oxidation carrier protein SoxY [Anaeromyxobacter sp. PSR-1]GAO01183.1 sulfur oxidation protein SoxY [Anaeromyxobacter sp. PSR-1]
MREVEQAGIGRRRFLETTGGATLLGMLVAAGILKPSWGRAADWNKAAFEARTMKEALDALGAGAPADSKDIAVTAPDIAENGAVVPITATSNLPDTESIAFLVEANPNMLAASFLLTPASLPVVSTRVKMARTSNVSVLVKAGGRFYVATKEIKVTLGGCGG